jgi:RNA polymerase sigma-70 factor (ECF subfamily)
MDLEKYRKELVGYCQRRRVPNPEDVVQDVFVRAIEYAHTFTPGTNLRAWLFSIMLRTVIPNRARKASRGQEVYVEEYWAESPDPGPDLQVEVNEVLDAIATMPEMYREILTLRVVLGYSFNEIIEILDVPLGTALSRVHRGKLALKEILGDD